MRKADELSTTTAPAFTAAGANFFDMPLPAENSAISTPSKLFSVSSVTVMSLPLYGNVLPAECAEASRRSSPKRNLRVAKQERNSTPTAPVAPTIATVGLDFMGHSFVL